MKKLIAILLVLAGAWFLWTRFGPPKISGPEIPEQSRILRTTERERFSIADSLDKGTWTVLLFTGGNAPESSAVARRMEVAVRQRVTNVRLVIIDVGDVDSGAAREVGPTKLPAAHLYKGFSRRSDDLEQILALLGA